MGWSVCVVWQQVEGSFYLAADMRLMCYTQQWWGFAIYGAIMCVLYVAGLPLGILRILFPRRNKLFGPGSEDNMRLYGFLYDVSTDAAAPSWHMKMLCAHAVNCRLVVVADGGGSVDVNPSTNTYNGLLCVSCVVLVCHLMTAHGALLLFPVCAAACNIGQSYGPAAWFWETEELIRKLVLTGVAVTMDSGNPLQITLAVMMSGWAHVIHAVYKVRSAVGALGLWCFVLPVSGSLLARHDGR